MSHPMCHQYLHISMQITLLLLKNDPLACHLEHAIIADIMKSLMLIGGNNWKILNIIGKFLI
jgi:hypothetical protein